jgi:hypothetical protein
MLSYDEVYSALRDARTKVSFGEPVVAEVHDSGNKEVVGVEEEDFVVYVQVAIPYTGTIPENHRVLNALMSDYISSRAKNLEVMLNKPVLTFLSNEYKGVADFSDLLQGMEDYLWEDQVDYVPLVDAPNKKVYVTLELMLSMEQTENEGQG